MQKKIICLIIMLISVLGIYTNVFAFDLITNVNTNTIEDNKLQISLQVSDLGDNPEGINAISGKIVYDSDIFENVSLNGINNWSAVYNDEKGNENQGKFILITTAGNINKEMEVVNIEFILKENVNNVKTQIKIEDIQTSYKSEKVETDNKNIDIEINNNSIRVLDKLDKDNTKNNTSNYIMYIIFIVIIIALIFLIKRYKEMKTNEK